MNASLVKIVSRSIQCLHISGKINKLNTIGLTFLFAAVVVVHIVSIGACGGGGGGGARRGGGGEVILVLLHYCKQAGKRSSGEHTSFCLVRVRS